MKRYLLFTATIFLTLAMLQPARAQETKAQKKAEKIAQVKSWMDAQSYVFVAQTALPMNGRSRNITPDYNLAVTADSVVSYLPFFGRAYTADYGATKSPLDFKTKSCEYKITPGKKDGWNVTIKPKDNKSVQAMNLTVSSEGYASLQVTSYNRTPMSFNGYVTEMKAKKSKQ